MTDIHLYINIYSEIQRFFFAADMARYGNWVKLFACDFSYVHFILHASMKKTSIIATLLILPMVKFDEFLIICNIIIILLSVSNWVIFLIFVSLKFFSRIYSSFKGKNSIILKIKTAGKVHEKMVYSQVSNFGNFSFQVSSFFRRGFSLSHAHKLSGFLATKLNDDH